MGGSLPLVLPIGSRRPYPPCLLVDAAKAPSWPLLGLLTSTAGGTTTVSQMEGTS